MLFLPSNDSSLNHTKERKKNVNRREFIGAGAALFAASGCSTLGDWGKPKIAGFDQVDAGDISDVPWTPFSDRKVRVGIAGEGFCEFGSCFGYQNHPNVEVVACAELTQEKRDLLQKRVGAKKAYTSCEDMIRHAAEDRLEAVYIATDAPSHIRLAIMALEHGLNVVTAVPAFWGKDQLEFVSKLLDAEKRSGKIYMMNETSAFRASCYAMRKLYEAGAFGAIAYTEGEYFHGPGVPTGEEKPLPRDHFSYKGWRWGNPPQYYPTHSNAYYTCVTHKRFTEVTCTGVPSLRQSYKDNAYGNPYGSEFAMFKCEDGSAARMLCAFDMPSHYGEDGRIWGQFGCFVPEKGGFKGFQGKEHPKVDIRKPQLPPGMPAGWHGGSHGYLTDDFIRGILVKDHKVCVDAKTALDTTIAGVYAHLSAMKGGETLKIPEAV